MVCSYLRPTKQDDFQKVLFLVQPLKQMWPTVWKWQEIPHLLMKTQIAWTTRLNTKISNMYFKLESSFLLSPHPEVKCKRLPHYCIHFWFPEAFCALMMISESSHDSTVQTNVSFCLRWALEHELLMFLSAPLLYGHKHSKVFRIYFFQMVNSYFNLNYKLQL